MKKLLTTLVLAALLTSTTYAADQVPSFNAMLTMGKERRFVLANTTGKTSEFLRLGDTFDGYTIKSYEPKTDVLELERDGKVVTVTLVGSTIVNGPATAAASAAATLAEAQAVLKAMNFEEMMDKTLAGVRKSQAAMVDQMMGQLAGTGADRESLVAFQKKLLDEMMGSMNGAEMKDDMAKAYSEVFTKDELQNLAAFYNSPFGKTFSEKTPLLQQKMNEVMTPRMMAAMPKIQQMARDFSQEQRAKRQAAGGAPGGAAPTAPAPKQ
jgi:hypothetical protein